ncbi:NUDIX domain-containing protein [Fluviispira sanaruensis]|uniref:Nudix hydrolase domain-containing protein n=1 Tax=Fluviispira sanaruensis TaxID=2493639 RepID=A0A4P2VVQ0_FLUSA|nr:NUDIX hydrolase [Fluviispira sanaruensis]BBH53625.1 hypothetical protein JCM31447_20720 [Fluviispira sanaruensis]
MKTKHRATCLFIYENSILLIKMQDPISKIIYWYPPGGKIEQNETAVETVKREVREETGFELQLLNEDYVITEYEMLLQNMRCYYRI